MSFEPASPAPVAKSSPQSMSPLSLSTLATAETPITWPSTCIWQSHAHLAFTDLVFFADAWFCVFREALAHVSAEGALRIIRSRDGEHWFSVALISQPGVDLRDGKLIPHPSGSLQLIGAAVRYQPDYQLQSQTWFSTDGCRWGNAQPIGPEHMWLWRMTWHATEASTHTPCAYAVGYHAKNPRFAQLYQSQNGLDFTAHGEPFAVNGYANEAALQFSDGMGATFDRGEAWCLLRRDPDVAMLGRSKAPYVDWQWQACDRRIGGPQALCIHGIWLTTVRLYDNNIRTSVCRLEPDGQLTEVITLPSAGDCSYAGMVCHATAQGQELWISYYSSHGATSAIYLAKIPFQ
jgi:hypothetical protein